MKAQIDIDRLSEFAARNWEFPKAFFRSAIETRSMWLKGRMDGPLLAPRLGECPPDVAADTESFTHWAKKQTIKSFFYWYMDVCAPEERENAPKSKSKPNEPNRRVFVVHGHDHGLKTSVQLALERLGLNPVVLGERPNRGRTIIEKFEENADVGFAVVLMTPDDCGHDKERPPAAKRATRQNGNRARQNVMLELGYFLAKLGRNRVMVISDPAVELPSDMYGIVYADSTKEAEWQKGLVKELRAAGYDVDANKLFSL